MQADDVEIIRKFGLSDTAARVYLALLELGKASADKIAKRVGTYKANTYDALDRLIEIGLASYIIEGKKRLFIPTSPEKLKDSAEEAKQRADDNHETLKNDLERIMPKLSAKYRSVSQKEIFEIYVGKKAYMSLIREILREKPKFWKGFGNLQVQEFFPGEFRSWFRQTKFMLFSNRNETVMNRLKEAKKTTSVKIIWLPEEVQMEVVWTLFGENLLILIYEPDIISIRIKSKRVVKTFSQQFDYLWKKHST